MSPTSATPETLTLFYHPLASFCHKVLIALYESDTPFASQIIGQPDQQISPHFLALWPIGKFPLLRDEKRDRTIPESSIIIEYLAQHYPRARPLVPQDEDRRLDALLWDRFFDLYVQTPMQRIVADRLRAEGERDPRGVADARAMLATAYDMLERQTTGRTWAVGEFFSIADCAAVPALFYAGIIEPFPKTHARLAAYFDRLLERPSVQRVIDEARPYFSFFPFKDSIPTRFLSR